MLNCKETIQLVSEGLDRQLSRWQRMNLFLHIRLCGTCRAYKRQIEGLHKLFMWYRQRETVSTATGSADDTLRLTAQKREQIKRLLESDNSGHAH